MKVKEPQLIECQMLRKDKRCSPICTSPPIRAQAKALMKSGATAIAYETVTAPNGSLPLLTPMSEVAGRMSIQVGAKPAEGERRLRHAAGRRAGRAAGQGSDSRRRCFGHACGGNGRRSARRCDGGGSQCQSAARAVRAVRSALRTCYSTTDTIEGLVRDADLVVGAVLVAGAAAPKLVTRAMVKTMKPGAVLVDISIDQGGCFETSRPTTHADPTFVVDGVIHYCVANMPGAVPRTSTFALTNATLPYVRSLADLGWRHALALDPGLAHGLNVHAGQLTHEAVASALGLDFRAFRAA